MKGNENYKILKRDIKGVLPYQLVTMVISFIYLSINFILIINMQRLVDTINFGGDISPLIKKFGILLIIFFSMSFIQQFSLRYLFILGNNKLMSYIYKKLLEKNIVFFSNKNTGDLNSIMMNDSEQVATWLVSGWVIRMLQVFVLIGTISIMISYSLGLTLIILSIVAICFLGINIVAKKVAKLSGENFKLKGEINQFILESIGSINIIKILRKEDYFYEKFNKIVNIERFNLNKKEAKYFSLYMAITHTLIMTIPFVAVGIGALMAANGEITIGSIIAFYALTGQLQEPIRVIAESFSQEKSAMELSNRLGIIINNNGIENGSEIINGFEKLNIDIEKFSYGDKDLLKGVNLKINPNKTIILKGESGSGKSTLGNLILGILELENGSIKINEKEVKDINKNSLWQYILNQGQDHLILKGTLYENLTLGDNYSDKDIEKVIEISCLEDFVKEYGIDREFEESGKNISGGQKQRISLARILLRKPELLILDEPTSALDNKTSEKIVKNIIDFSKENNMGLIVISHRDDFDKYADEIVKLSA